MQTIVINESLVETLAKAAREGLSMAGIRPTPVGASRHASSSHEVSAIVGIVGQTSGAVMINVSPATACFLVSSMLGEKHERLTPQVLDGVCEITNIVAGQVKALLSSTEWAADRISCPSVVVGTNYVISHFRGMESVSIEFEVDEMPMISLEDRFFSVSLSLMRG